MKTKLLLAALWLSTLSAHVSTGFAQGTAFTYQGRLDESSGPANGSYDFSFQLFDAASGGASQGGPLTNRGVSVSDGYFTVTVDFGLDPFRAGAPRWLEIGARTSGDGPLGLLSPRQALTPTPYAITASSVVSNGLAGGTYANAVAFNHPANSFSGTFSGNGAGVSNVNATTLGGLAAPSFWQVSGNTGTTPGSHFLGTTDNQPLEFKVNGLRVLRLEPTGSNDTVNIIGGSARNFVGAGVVGATIGGGGSGNHFGTAHTNRVESNFGTVSGGAGNMIQSNAINTAIGGGRQNTIQTDAYSGTIGGGLSNTIESNAPQSTISGGVQNKIQINSSSGTIGGGYLNTVAPDAQQSTIGGGNQNTIAGYGSVIAGGRHNSILALADGSTIGGGEFNQISGSQDLNVRNSIGGGSSNTTQTNAIYAVIGGGGQNTILTNAQYATIPGGNLNSAAGNYSLAAGRQAKALHDGAFVWADSQGADFASTGANQFLIRASGGVGIGTPAPASALHVKDAVGATEISVESSDPGGHRWTLQSSGISGNASLDASFQIIDRTLGVSRLLIGTNGFVGIGTSNPTNRLHVAGGVSATAFVTTSDRNAKENFAAVSPAEVLAKVASLPILQWNFKEMKDGRHLGPMAQDFYAAFGLGGGETTITTVDADGVALAAIQGLNQELEKQRAENAELKQRLEKLERLFSEKRVGVK